MEIVVRNCHKHGLQTFYETVSTNCLGEKIMRWRCSVCKHEYYKNNSEKIMRRQCVKSAERQRKYRKRAKTDALAAYCQDLSCCVCKSREGLELVSFDGRKIGYRECADLRKKSFPDGFHVLCSKCSKLHNVGVAVF